MPVFRPCRAWSLAAAGMAAALLMPVAASAAEAQRKVSGHDHEQKPVLVSADEMTYDDQLDIVTARGNVELSQGGRTLLADMVSYNQRSDTVIATGHVSLIDDATGATTFGNYVELHDNMRDGFVRDVRMLLADRSRVAANVARRSDGNRTEMAHGVYSPCDLCATDPSAPPIWQIRADRITHDKQNQLVEFYDATIDFGGVPSLWLPYLSHPDPTVKRQSGLLPFTVGNNTILGAYAEIPYYFVLSDDKDLTLTTLFTTDQNTVFQPEYRERFDNGFIDLTGSITYSDPDPSPAGPSNASQLRGYFSGFGEFDLDDSMRAKFSIQRTSDTVYLNEYKIGTFENFLRSNVELEDFQGRNYGSIDAYDFQSLQSDVENRIQPVVLPVATYTWAGAPMSWGGRFTTTLNLLDIIRETGSSDQRASLGTEFDLPFTSADGQRFNFLAALRGDAYYTTSLAQVANGPLVDTDAERAFPQIGLEWSYPWLLRDGGSAWIVEPKAAIYAAPVGLNPTTIPNDDSEAVDFNDADLFSHNRFAGFDQVDSGQRVDYGLHVNWRQTGGAMVDFLAGQSFRFQNTSPFAIEGTGDGLERPLSDYVGRITIIPADQISFSYHFRFDQRDLRPERQEVNIGENFQPFGVSLNYVQIGNNVRDGLTARQQVGLRLDLALGTYWSTYASGTRDFGGDLHLLAAEVGVRYVDECTTVVASIGTDGQVIGNYRPGTTVMLQVVMKNLGVITTPLLETQLGGQ